MEEPDGSQMTIEYGANRSDWCVWYLRQYYR